MTTVDPQNSQVPLHRQIAGAMASAMTAEAEFADLLIEQVTDPKRRLKSMTEGDVLVDCIGVGMRSEPGNRRARLKLYTTHAAVRAKLPGGVPTDSDLERLGFIAERVQTYFEDQHSLTLPNGQLAKLTSSEPFAHVVRSQLFGDGLFTSPIQFTWTVL